MTKANRQYQTIRMDADLKERLTARSKFEGRSKSDLIEEALEIYLRLVDLSAIEKIREIGDNSDTLWDLIILGLGLVEVEIDAGHVWYEKGLVIEKY